MNKKQILPYEELYEAYLNVSQERYKYKQVIDKIKEYIKDNGIDKEMVECCNIYDINGIDIYKILEEIE